MNKVYASRNIGTAEIQVVIGDIAKQSDIDTVVNAANSKLLNGSGVCGAIFHAAGAEELSQACRKLAPINVGDAVITNGFKLPNHHIIHSCGPKFKESSDAVEKLAICYENILRLSEKFQISSLAVPAISTGAFGFPIEEATRICINSIKDESPSLNFLKTIRFVVRDEAVAGIYAHYLLEEIPLPERAIRIDCDVQLSVEQFQRIRRGLIGDHDNPWFMYFEEPWFYIFRAMKWVGQCLFFLKFEPIDDGYKVAEAWVDSESPQFHDENYSEFLYEQIDFLLSRGDFISLIEGISASYCVLRKGRVNLVIHDTISLVEMRLLGLKLIELKNKLDD